MRASVIVENLIIWGYYCPILCTHSSYALITSRVDLFALARERKYEMHTEPSSKCLFFNAFEFRYALRSRIVRRTLPRICCSDDIEPWRRSGVVNRTSTYSPLLFL